MLALCAFTSALAIDASGDQSQLEKYGGKKFTKYHLDVPGKEPITILETASSGDVPGDWVDISVNLGKEKDDIEIKNLMTDIIHDNNGERPRCYGPSCQDGFMENQGPQGDLEELIRGQEYQEQSKDFRDYSTDRLQAIKALAAKLKNDKIKADRYNGQYQITYPNLEEEEEEEDNGKKVYTSWNRLKVKQHKHPYDDKDGWVTLEPVAWSTSKISKWKPNVKKHKPTSWHQQQNTGDDRFSNDDPYSSYQGIDSMHNYPKKRPAMSSTRPTYINNKLHATSASPSWDSEMPSKPSWNKPDNFYSYPSTWNPDEGRRPNKPNCDSEEHGPDDDTVLYEMSDSVVTDNRPSYFPYEYEALKRPMRRPTQVVYVGNPELDSERASRPPLGDGQWVLLSTTKGYRNKKRQRSLNVKDELSGPTTTSHHAVALTVLPSETRQNMTTSHGGLLEVERSFKTVEESKRDMDRENEFRPDEVISSTDPKPSTSINKRVIRKKLISSVAPDSSAIIAAVGAGMVPATMAMVVPMMLGKRKRRDIQNMRHVTPSLPNIKDK